MTIDLSFLIVILNFALLLLVLNKLLYKPLKGFFDDRQMKIQNDVKEAEESIQKANLLIIEKEEELKKAHIEAKEIRDSVIKDAESQADLLIHNAKQQERDIVQQAKNKIEEMNSKVKDELAREMADLIASFTGQVLFEKIDAAKDKELISRLLSKRG